MKEFIDKLIERLEEEHERCINRYGIVGGNLPAMEVKQCMEIVNELVEEYNGEELRKSQKIYNFIKREINPYGKPFEGTVYEFGLKVMKYIENLHTEEYKVSEMPTGWISVSEGLPKYTDEYNVAVDVASEFGCYRTVKALRFERIEGKEPKWVIPQDEVYRVIAWCELPAPYTEGE